MGRTAISKLRLFLAASAVGLFLVAPAASAPATPVPVGPPDGTSVTFLPTVAWAPVSGADHYIVEFGVDPAFNPALFTISTKNTRAVPDKTVPNGTYYWRVQAFDSAGSGSPWSPPMALEKNWAGNTSLTQPDNGATISYPADPLVLRWTAVAGAAKYRVFIASDATLGSLVGDGNPIEVQAVNLAPNLLLPANTYYWAVTPLDAQGNPGERSSIRSFTWEWPSTTTPQVNDLISETELYDPQFTWDAVPGAARYEVEVNSSSDFASGSWVCCTDKTIATTLTPKEVFLSNTYYWRIRAIDKAGNAGVWNEGPSFVKTFDNYPDLSEDSIKNLRMRDAADPGTDLSPDPGYQTDDPILTWDPVPGASSYQVDVVPFDTISAPGRCDWTIITSKRWTVPTATTAWTPLGNANATLPYSTGTVSKDVRTLVPGESYCARVRARSGRYLLSTPIWGDYTFLGDGDSSPSFTFTSFPTGGACSPSCNANYLGADDYTLPIRGETIGQNPLFTWNPIAGMQSYWVIVSKNPSFTNIVDYAITRIPAYAVRTGTAARTYADETTSYYWVVLPATGTNGSGAPGNPALGAYADFQKQTTPPDLLSPANGTIFTGQPTLQWSSVPGARRYHLQVAYEPTFGTRVDDLTVSSTAYTALTTYDSAATIYWRVQPEDENGTGLTWSATGTFQVALPAPTIDPSNLTTSDNLPVVFWSAVPGAVDYELQVQNADGAHEEFTGFPSHAASWEKMTGAGILTLRVRAHFPKSSASTTTAGPWSDPEDFIHTIHEPANPSEDVAQNRIALAWDAKTGMKQYRVQISARQDFAPFIESKTTDNPSFAPTLASLSYKNGGTFYWRVAAVDADSNLGDFTGVRSFSFPAMTTTTAAAKKFKLAARGYLVRGRLRTITITVKDLSSLGAVPGARVQASGAGVLATKLTGATGLARFSLKPRKLGTVTFRISKSGYTTAFLYRKVRAS